MNSPTPIDAVQADAIERGRIFRARGGTFQTTISEAHHNGDIYTYEAKYPPSEYDAKGILMPSDPIKGRLIGISAPTEAEEARVDFIAPVRRELQHVLTAVGSP